LTATIVLAIGLPLLYHLFAGYAKHPISYERVSDVLVASELIPAGTTVEEAVVANRLETHAIPEDDVPEAAVTNIAVLEDQVALVDIAPGQQLLTTMFGDE
jgi:flagella basal body P-ring formation protein FlgA